jgi:hypothetical protein
MYKSLDFAPLYFFSPYLETIYCHTTVKIGKVLEYELDGCRSVSMRFRFRCFKSLQLVRIFEFQLLGRFPAVSVVIVGRKHYLQQARFRRKSGLKLHFDLLDTYRATTKINRQPVRVALISFGIPATARVFRVERVSWSVHFDILLQYRGGSERG